MKKMTDEDVLKASEELYKQIEAETNPFRKENCKFFGKDGKRYCLATTHKTCDRCRFYEPTIFAKLRTLVKNTEKLKYMVEELQKEKESLELKVKTLEWKLQVEQEGGNDEQEVEWPEPESY